MSNKTVIYRSPHLVATYVDHGSSWVCATFNEKSHSASSGMIWGETLFNQMRLSAIGFVSTRPNWYPPHEALAAITSFKNAVAAKNLITYGFSQGGYGALKYSALLNARAALAFCPQWSIDPAFVGSFDPRFTRFHSAALRNGGPIRKSDLCDRSFVFYDPREDIDHVHAITLATVGVNRVPVYFSGHDTVRLLSESGLAAQFLTSFMSSLSRGQPIQPRQWIRRTRSHSTTYVGHLFRHLAAKNKTSLAVEIAECLPSSLRGISLIVLAAARNDIAMAERQLSSISDDELIDVGLRDLWSLFKTTKLECGELRVSRLISRVVNDDLFLRLHAVQTYVNLGLHAEARVELTTLRDTFDCSLYAGLINTLSQHACRDS
jgi:hypothetical protein